MGEWRSLGAAKNAKFAKASNLRKTPLFDFDSRLRLQKPNQQAKPFYRRGTMRGEEGAGEYRKGPMRIRELGCYKKKEIIMKTIYVLFFSFLIASVFASPTVTDVTAKQRFPWNGLVDIKCKVAGIEDSKPYEFSVDAVMPDSGTTNKLSQFGVMQNGTRQNNFKVTANGDYHLIWDAKAELGSVLCTNMIVCVMLEDGRDKVQLWEGGPYWATTNIGAEKPEDYGYYFWWGDTVGYKRENDKWVASDGSNSNFSFSGGNTPTYSKSISTLQSEGWLTSDGVLAPEHDAATVHWGNGWRMPTKDELSALNNKCDWTWTTLNGVIGYVVKGRGAYASKSIFLSAAGHGDGTSLSLSGSGGDCWSSVPFSDGSNAYYLSFGSSIHHTHSYWRFRYNGQSVRPVLGFTK